MTLADYRKLYHEAEVQGIDEAYRVRSWLADYQEDIWIFFKWSEDAGLAPWTPESTFALEELQRIQPDLADVLINASIRTSYMAKKKANGRNKGKENKNGLSTHKRRRAKTTCDQ